MTESTQQLLARVPGILARAEKTPTGPWFWRKCYELDTFDGLSRLWALKNEENPERIISIRGGLAHDYFTSPAQWHADPVNQFIAAARSDIPALCKAVQELANERAELVGLLSSIGAALDDTRKESKGWFRIRAYLKSKGVYDGNLQSEAVIVEACDVATRLLPSPPQEKP